jgi:hypothetical protein
MASRRDAALHLGRTDGLGVLQTRQNLRTSADSLSSGRRRRRDSLGKSVIDAGKAGVTLLYQFPNNGPSMHVRVCELAIEDVRWMLDFYKSVYGMPTIASLTFLPVTQIELRHATANAT